MLVKNGCGVCHASARWCAAEQRKEPSLLVEDAAFDGAPGSSSVLVSYYT
jgi:hypothetical protein